MDTARSSGALNAWRTSLRPCEKTPLLRRSGDASDLFNVRSAHCPDQFWQRGRRGSHLQRSGIGDVFEMVFTQVNGKKYLH